MSPVVDRCDPSLQKHRCIQLPKNGPKYPACIDAKIAGDPASALSHLEGDWYKVQGWKLGEPIECMPCQKARFAAAGSSAVSFNSTWHQPDDTGKLHLVDVVAHMQPDQARGPGKFYNTGEMFGLTYWEPYTIVKDASNESEPFVFFYVCGGTLQGNYTTAFALAKMPVPTTTLHARLASVAASVGLREADFCHVDNGCFGGRR